MPPKTPFSRYSRFEWSDAELEAYESWSYVTKMFDAINDALVYDDATPAMCDQVHAWYAEYAKCAEAWQQGRAARKQREIERQKAEAWCKEIDKLLLPF